MNDDEDIRYWTEMAAMEHAISQAIATATTGIVALCGYAHNIEGREYMRKNIRHIDHIVAGAQMLGSAFASDKQSNVVPFAQRAAE